MSIQRAVATLVIGISLIGAGCASSGQRHRNQPPGPDIAPPTPAPLGPPVPMPAPAPGSLTPVPPAPPPPTMSGPAGGMMTPGAPLATPGPAMTISPGAPVPAVPAAPAPAVNPPPMPSPAPAGSAAAPSGLSAVSGTAIADARPMATGGVQTPTVAPAAMNPAMSLHHLAERAQQRMAGVDSYIARLRRREQVNGRNKPEEVLLFKWRKHPFSVYFKWVGSEAHGREVTYVEGQHGGMIHTRLAAGDMPLVPAGRRMALAPDNMFVRSASRHSITKAGIGHLVDEFAALVAAQERGDQRAGTLSYQGMVSRADYDSGLESVEQMIPPGLDPQLPRGGRRLWMFEPTTHLPVLILTRDATGQEVEYYCYDRLQLGVRLDDGDFDPDRLWGPGR